MDKNYTINIDHKLRIIKYTHSGSIKAEDIGGVWEQFLTMKEFTQLKYNLFSDYSNGTFQIPHSFLPELMEFMHSIKEIVRGKKQALIVNDPHNVATSMIFESKANKEVGFIVKVFTTQTSALRWLSV